MAHRLLYQSPKLSLKISYMSGRCALFYHLSCKVNIIKNNFPSITPVSPPVFSFLVNGTTIYPAAQPRNLRLIDISLSFKSNILLALNLFKNVASLFLIHPHRSTLIQFL